MSALERISRTAAERGASFLLIGGHAVIVHGYARTTFDLDLLIRLKDTNDLVQLIEINRLDVTAREFQAVITKHGPEGLYDQLARVCGKD